MGTHPEVRSLHGGKPVTIRVRVRTTVEQDGDAFHAFAPALRGCHVGGRTLDEARQNLYDAINLYLSALIERGLPIPVGCESEVVESQDMTAWPRLDGIEVGQSVSANKDLDIRVPVPA